ncbi:RNA demethylase ALKBH10B-like isoform X2 [Andrographis paniculata]|uniref:RNA demethylase ALKBH10B-like isoform X2 n=1 Tax=Andrographis paniculata TaxID=175694 RepID=UPI0021E80DA8|nr:RNA demethylase ALKBH10B-like isoform X2 [Andrographis paniculata]
MPPAAGVAAQGGDRAAVKPMAMPGLVRQPPMSVMPATDAFAKDAIIAWFRGEFAAANAIIDALCSHLAELEGGATGTYESAFAAIHRRRMNWIPILQLQKFYSIGDVTAELKKVSEEKRAWNDVDAQKKIDEEEEAVGPTGACTEASCGREKQKEKIVENSTEDIKNGGAEAVDEDLTSEITDAVSQEAQPLSPEQPRICSNHGECGARCDQIKMTKGYIAKEPVKGHMMNVVRGLKLYEETFTDLELSKLIDFVNELRVSGQNGELSGDTFILYNQQTKGNKRELVQLGVPIFGQIKKDETITFHTKDIEPIPALLQSVIDHLIQWRIIPENRKPNSCIINFFDEGEYSQPFMKPPHLEQPISTLLLSESSMAFGRTLVSDGEGNYRGPLVLSLKEGSLLVMRGNSSDTARHAMCSSTNKRVSVSFFRVRAESETAPLDATVPTSKAMALWQPTAVSMTAVAPNSYDPINLIPKWGFLRAPMVMLAPVRPVPVNNPKRIIPRGGGTGVFLPWAVGSRKHVKHLPPRAQRGRLLSLPSSSPGVNNNNNSSSSRH